MVDNKNRNKKLWDTEGDNLPIWDGSLVSFSVKIFSKFQDLHKLLTFVFVSESIKKICQSPQSRVTNHSQWSWSSQGREIWYIFHGCFQLPPCKTCYKWFDDKQRSSLIVNQARLSKSNQQKTVVSCVWLVFVIFSFNVAIISDCLDEWDENCGVFPSLVLFCWEFKTVLWFMTC